MGSFVAASITVPESEALIIGFVSCAATVVIEAHIKKIESEYGNTLRYFIVLVV
jgi:hypothetical protein